MVDIKDWNIALAQAEKEKNDGVVTFNMENNKNKTNRRIAPNFGRDKKRAVKIAQDKQNINKLFDDINDLLVDLGSTAVSNGILLDNDLSTAVFRLLLDDDFNEMTLVKNRIESAIKKINDGTFKIKDIEDIQTLKVA